MPNPNEGNRGRPTARPEVLTGPPALIERLPAISPIHGSVDTLRHALQSVADKVHLLSPTMSPEFIPEFHDVAIRLVVVDARDESGEIYKLPGAGADERALSKVALDRIWAAAGGSWDPMRSGRLDDGSSPFYCRYRAVGRVRDLDGSWRILMGEKEIDLRPGNPSIYTDEVDRMRHKWDDARKRYTDEIENPGFVKGWSEQRLAEARTHILAMAESKAKNRVIRSLGLKQKYRVGELATKPFAVLSLVMTGRSADPQLERMAKERMLDAALSSAHELYGGATTRHVALPTPTPADPLPPLIEVAPPPPLPDAPAPRDDDDIPDCGCPDGPANVHEEGCEYGN